MYHKNKCNYRVTINDLSHSLMIPNNAPAVCCWETKGVKLCVISGWAGHTISSLS